VLDSYATERHAVGRQVLKMTDTMTRFMELRNPVASAIRDRIASALSSSEIFQSLARRGMAELNVNYRDSPIVAEYHEGLFRSIAALGGSGPRAGDRAPDADGLQVHGTTKRLYELLRADNHKLLIFTDQQSSLDVLAILVSGAQQVNSRCDGHVTVFMILDSDDTKIPGWNGDVIIDASGALRRAYHAVASCTYVIRPDGYVAYRLYPIEWRRLLEFLSRIFE